MSNKRSTFQPLTTKTKLLSGDGFRPKNELKEILKNIDQTPAKESHKPKVGYNTRQVALTSFGIIVGIVATTSVPANATEINPETDSQQVVTQSIAIQTQNLNLDSTVDLAPALRDKYGATSQEELDARKAAAAAEQAKADAQAKALAARAARPSQAVNKTGIVGNQIFAADSIIGAAQQWIGVVPYGMGNNPSDSFSCDGYVQYVFAQNGISLPRGADNQAALGAVITREEAKAGDLVWWPHRHVGIYDGNDGYYNSPTWGRFVEHGHFWWGNPVFVRL